MALKGFGGLQIALEDSVGLWRAQKCSGGLWGPLEDDYEKIWVMICVRGAGGYLDWEVKLSL